MNRKIESVIRSYILRDEMSSMLRYLDEMEVNEESKEDLIQAIKMYRLRVLYNVMLTKFSGMLSDEEKEKYERERQIS